LFDLFSRSGFRSPHGTGEEQYSREHGEIWHLHEQQLTETPPLESKKR
jgi:hypothetical protein